MITDTELRFRINHLLDINDFSELELTDFIGWPIEQRVMDAILLCQQGQLPQAHDSLETVLGGLAKATDDQHLDVCYALMKLKAFELVKVQLATVEQRCYRYFLLSAALAEQEGDAQTAQLHYVQSLTLNDQQIFGHTLYLNYLFSNKKVDELSKQADVYLAVLSHRQFELSDHIRIEQQAFAHQGRYEGLYAHGRLYEIEDELEQASHHGLLDTLVLKICAYCSCLIAHKDIFRAQAMISQYQSSLLEQHSLKHMLLERIAPLNIKPLTLRLLMQCLKLDQDNISLHLQVASAAETIRPRLAKGMLRRAEKKAASQDNPQAEKQVRMAKAMSYCQKKGEGEPAKAVEELQKLVADGIHNVNVFSQLSQQYMILGEIDKAIEYMQKVEQIAPLQGLSQLINARQFPQDLNIIDQAAQQIYAGTAPTSLAYNLALAYEKLEAYEQAWQLLDYANKEESKSLTYSAKAHRLKCLKIRSRFNQDFFNHRQGFGIRSKRLIFVVGMPRSGTTLVEQILASHSRVFGAGELGNMPQLIQGINRWQRNLGTKRQYPDCVDDITISRCETMAKEYLSELDSVDAEHDFIADKLPHNFENVGLIKFLFPDAKIISVRRTPQDIAISNYYANFAAKDGGMGFAYSLRNIGEQLADHANLMAHWDRVFPDQIHSIQYEQLVDDPETHIRSMLAYLNIEFEPALLSHNKLEREVKTASVWQVRQPIYKSSKERWKHYQPWLGFLYRGTNRKLDTQLPDTFFTLPVPGLFTTAREYFAKREWDQAEYILKQLLTHNNDHASAHYLLALVYAEKCCLEQAKASMELALALAPWKKAWREDLTTIKNAEANIAPL